MITIDVETIPLNASLAAEYPAADRQPPANYKSEDAIAKWRANDEADWRNGLSKQCSLNPRLGRLLSVAYAVDEDPAATLYAPTEQDEVALLNQFWSLMRDGSAWQVVTWNGAFDLRFLVVRSLAHGIAPTVQTSDWFRRYSTEPHCDVKAFLLQEYGVRDKGESMDAWAAFFGLPPKPEAMDGSKVYPAFLAGEHDKIQRYNCHDVDCTRAMYQRIKPYL